MSSLPECQRCGNYIHHGPVICDECTKKENSLLSKYCTYLKRLLEDNNVSHVVDFEKWSRPLRGGLTTRGTDRAIASEKPRELDKSGYYKDVLSR